MRFLGKVSAILPTVYKPISDIAIDEQLVATHGRYSFHQYNTLSNPGKYGIKIFWANDAETSYPLKGEVYIGKQPVGTARLVQMT